MLDLVFFSINSFQDKISVAYMMYIMETNLKSMHHCWIFLKWGSFLLHTAAKWEIDINILMVMRYDRNRSQCYVQWYTGVIHGSEHLPDKIEFKIKFYTALISSIMILFYQPTPVDICSSCWGRAHHWEGKMTPVLSTWWSISRIGLYSMKTCVNVFSFVEYDNWYPSTTLS